MENTAWIEKMPGGYRGIRIKQRVVKQRIMMTCVDSRGGGIEIVTGWQPLPSLAKLGEEGESVEDLGCDGRIHARILSVDPFQWWGR